MAPTPPPRGLSRFAVALCLFSVVAYALRPRGRAAAGPVERPAGEREPALERRPATRRTPGRRLALAFAFAMMFFAGAALTAGAGDRAGRLLDDVETATTAADDAPATVEAPPAVQTEPAFETTPAPAPADELPADPSEPLGSEPTPGHEVARGAGADPAGAAPRSQPVGRAVARPRDARPQPARRTPAPKATAEQEAAVHGGASVIWLRRPLPDPTPRARRLDRWFVYDLLRASRAAGVDWALVLGVVRGRGHGGRRPVEAPQLEALAERLRAADATRDELAAALAATGSAERAHEAVALARYNRAVGTETLVRGLAASKATLAERLLKDGRAEIYAGGRDDLGFGRIDVRVVALISYLAESFGQVTVTSLFSGHGLYARPGVVSAHVYGHAVDIAGLAGLPITGNQAPGGLTEQAVRSILRLPAELQPRQVISLLGLGGASFPLANHHDHIHVGY